MAYIKTLAEIEKLKEGGREMGQILDALTLLVRPGVSTAEIDREAERLIIEAGGRPAFKGYKTRKSDPKFPSTICACINEEVVHGIPSQKKVLKEGDIFSIDIGMEWPYSKKEGGYYTDTALTVAVGSIPKETQKLLEVTREALEVGIRAAQVGNTIADIGRAIEMYIKSQGQYGIVRDLSGHGVGHAVHEDPWVPNYYVKQLESWKVEPGAVIAIEPMVTMGDWRVRVLDDGWTIVPVDKSLSAHFEHTLVVTEDGPEVITRRPSER